MSSTLRAVFSNALLTAGTEGVIPFCFSPASEIHQKLIFAFHQHYKCQDKKDLPERTKAMPPQAFGDDMDVPFISWVPRRVQLGTEAMAPPGALILTPRAPSVLGPRDDQVYWLGGSFSLREYSATIMSGVT